MNLTVRVLVFTLALPLLAAGFAWGAMAKLDGAMRDAVQGRHPELTREQLADVTVESLAARNAFDEANELPRIYARLKLARSLAMAVGGAGLLLLGAIHAAGRLTRTRRDLLLRIFRPGLYLTLTLVGLLTAVQAFALAYALYYFESIFVERVHFILIGGVAVGGGLALVAVGRAMFALGHSGEFDIVGRRVSREEQPRLWELVDGVCGELRTAAPDHLVLGIEPSFFVTEAPVVTRDGRCAGRTMFLSLALARLLSAAELRAIVGHEMAHFVGEDTAFSRRFFPVYRRTLLALTHLSRNAVHGSIAIAQMPAVSFLNFFFNAFVTSERNLSRRREIEADAVGARLAGATALATSLVKIHAGADLWTRLIDDLCADEDQARREQNFAVALHARALALTTGDLAGAGGTRQPHPTDTHPPLAERVRALEHELDRVASLAVVPAFSDSAAALIAGVEGLEAAQTERIKTLAVRR
ncbi:MAG TPA: M48 family metalloprotease [Opitutus sp.]|nr:M48 family metalloprotease [Opitutus sp.]